MCVAIQQQATCRFISFECQSITMEVLCAKVTWLSILFMQPQVITFILLHNIAMWKKANTRTLFYILLRTKVTLVRNISRVNSQTQNILWPSCCVFNYQRIYKFGTNITFTSAITATCFDSYESSSGYLWSMFKVYN